MKMTFPQVVQAAKTVHLKFKKMMNRTKLVALKPIKSIFQSPQRMQLVEIMVLRLLKASKARRNATTISRLKKKTMRKKRTRSSREATPTRAMKKRKMTQMKKNKAKRNSKARNNKSNMKKRIWMKW
jgi:hypothetical protein